MGDVLDTINDRAITPYMAKAITQEQAMDEIIKPIKKFMLAQTNENELGMFMKVAKQNKPITKNDIPLRVLIPAYAVSELKIAFQIGFLIYIPFLVIDMVISSVLMAMGMMMLPPTVVSLPFKLVLFILVDGWTLLIDSLVRSFN